MRRIEGTPTTDEPVLIAQSEAMRRVLDRARRAAGSDATVLIQGETGTGKELVARLIHRHSRRVHHPFVAVNCGAYNDSLLASELFGHVRGAFTGAVGDRPGVFRAATGGTVFLDEIAAMSPEMQIKMLRVLQERKVTPVGSSTELPIDVRVIAATNADLSDLTRRRLFREDLYYRVKIVTCDLPPLRDRREDIKPLMEHFLQYFAERFDKPGIILSIACEQALKDHHWPGNIRELRGELEKLVAIADPNSVVGPECLSEELIHRAAGGGHRRPNPTRPDPVPEERPPAGPSPLNDLLDPTATYQELIDKWTKTLVAQRLDRFAGNITKTAQSLNISRTTLYALLKKYQMHGRDE